MKGWSITTRVRGWSGTSRRSRGRGNGKSSEPLQRAQEGVRPGPVRGQVEVDAASGEGEASRHGEMPVTEGLGGHERLAQAEAADPASQVVSHDIQRQPGGIGGEAARGQVVEADAVL